jgi:predicted RNA-binding protein with PUA-like domain
MNLVEDGPVSERFWVVKQEPTDYPWSRFVLDQSTAWTGIRNFQARNHLRSMALGDRVLYYHSGSEKAVMGVAQVSRSAYPDPTAREGDWSAVDLQAICRLSEPVTLATIKADPVLQSVPFVRQTRLSVSPIAGRQFRRLLKLSRTVLPRP